MKRLLLLWLLTTAAASPSNRTTILDELTTSHPWLLPSDDDGVLASLLGSDAGRDAFFTQDFGRNLVQLSRSKLELPSPLAATQSNLIEQLYPTSPVTFRNRSSMDIVDTTRLAFSEFERKIQQGGSATMEVTDRESANNPLVPFRQQLEQALGMRLSMNIYHSGPGGSALRAHADRYDVFVLQVDGAKRWRICVPRGDGSNQADAASVANAWFRQDEAKPCGDISLGCSLEQEVARRQGVDCHTTTLRKGDVLYMPQGIIHEARASLSSTHAAIGLMKEPFRYGDFLMTLLQLASSLSFSNDEETRIWNRLQKDLLKKKILPHSPTPVGVAFRRLMPVWIWKHYKACYENTQQCNPPKHEESQRFLLASLKTMLSHLQEEAIKQMYQNDPDNAWKDEVYLRELLAIDDTSLLMDAIHLHLDTIRVDSLEEKDRTQIQKMEELSAQTDELLKKIWGTSGAGGMADMMESLKSTRRTRG